MVGEDPRSRAPALRVNYYRVQIHQSSSGLRLPSRIVSVLSVVYENSWEFDAKCMGIFYYHSHTLRTVYGTRSVALAMSRVSCVQSRNTAKAVFFNPTNVHVIPHNSGESA